MKLYCAISPLRIFFGSVFSPLSTSTYRPSLVSLSATSDAYSLCKRASSAWYHAERKGVEEKKKRGRT